MFLLIKSQEHKIHLNMMGKPYLYLKLCAVKRLSQKYLFYIVFNVSGNRSAIQVADSVIFLYRLISILHLNGYRKFSLLLFDQ